MAKQKRDGDSFSSIFVIVQSSECLREREGEEARANGNDSRERVTTQLAPLLLPELCCSLSTKRIGSIQRILSLGSAADAVVVSVVVVVVCCGGRLHSRQQHLPLWTDSFLLLLLKALDGVSLVTFHLFPSEKAAVADKAFPFFYTMASPGDFG